MYTRAKYLLVSLIITIVVTLSDVEVSRSQPISQQQTKSRLQTKHVPVSPGLLVYFLPIHSATFVPTGKDLIKHTGGELTLYSSEDVNMLLKLLEKPVSSAQAHSVAPAKIDGGKIRLRVEESKGEHLVFVGCDETAVEVAKVTKRVDTAPRCLI